MTTGISTIKDSPTMYERWVGWTLIASALSAAIGIVFLILFFSGVGGYFGTLNDIFVVIQYLLLLPIMRYTYRILPMGERSKTKAVQWMGMIGAITVILLQTMLVIDLIPFQRQIFLVIPAFLVVTAWFAIMERAGRDEPRLPKGKGLAILAGLVFGYPIWAFIFYRQLKTTQGHDPSAQEINQ